MNEELKRQRQRENSRRYYQKHKKEILLKQKIYVRKRYHEDEEFRKRTLEIGKKYRINNPEKVRETKRKSQLKYMNKKRINGNLPLTKQMQIELLNKKMDKAVEELNSQYRNGLISESTKITIEEILRGDK